MNSIPSDLAPLLTWRKSFITVIKESYESLPVVQPNQQFMSQ